MTREDIDRQVIDHLAHLAARDEVLETVNEIAEQLALTRAQVRSSLNRLKSYGEAREVGEAASGAKTWALTSDSRFPAAKENT